MTNGGGTYWRENKVKRQPFSPREKRNIVFNQNYAELRGDPNRDPNKSGSRNIRVDPSKADYFGGTQLTHDSGYHGVFSTINESSVENSTTFASQSRYRTAKRFKHKRYTHDHQDAAHGPTVLHIVQNTRTTTFPSLHNSPTARSSASKEPTEAAMKSHKDRMQRIRNKKSLSFLSAERTMAREELVRNHWKLTE